MDYSPKPRKPKGVKEPVQVYLDGPDRAILDQLSEAEGLSRAEVLRRGIRAYAASARATSSPLLALLDSIEAEARAAGVTSDEPFDPREHYSEHESRRWFGTAE